MGLMDTVSRTRTMDSDEWLVSNCEKGLCNWIAERNLISSHWLFKRARIQMRYYPCLTVKWSFSPAFGLVNSSQLLYTINIYVPCHMDSTVRTLSHSSHLEFHITPLNPLIFPWIPPCLLPTFIFPWLPPCLLPHSYSPDFHLSS